jgi:hypothetical protein
LSAVRREMAERFMKRLFLKIKEREPTALVGEH